MVVGVVVVVLLGAIFVQSVFLYLARTELVHAKTLLADQDEAYALPKADDEDAEENADEDALAKAEKALAKAEKSLEFYRNWSTELHKCWWSYKSATSIGRIIAKLELPVPENYVPRYDITCEPAPLCKPKATGARPATPKERRSTFHIVK